MTSENDNRDEPSLHDVEIGDDDSPKGTAAAATTATRSTTTNKYLSAKWLAFGALVVAALVCVITIPIVVTNNNNNNNSSNNSNSLTNAQSNTNTPNTDKNDTSSSSDTTKPGAGGTGTSTTGTNTGTTTQQQSYFERVNGPFNSSIELLNADVTSGYTDDADLEKSIDNAANYFLGVVYKQNCLIEPNDVTTTYTEDEVTSDGMMNDGGNIMADSPESSNQKQSLGSSSGFSDYGTNNQEQGVEEGDLIVSDGKYGTFLYIYGRCFLSSTCRPFVSYSFLFNNQFFSPLSIFLLSFAKNTVYTAYGKYVVAWDAMNSTIVHTIEMPAVNSTCDNSMRPMPFYEGDVVTEDATSTTASSSSSSKIMADDMMMYWCWPQEPYVQSLLINQNRLLVIVSGYGDQYKKKNATTGEQINVLDGYLSTQVRIYEIPSMSLLGMTDLNGYYSAVRQSPDGRQHIITTSSVNTWYHLQSPMNRFNFGTATTEEYTKNVTAMSERLSTGFTTQLMADLRGDGVKPLPNLVRINLFQSTASSTGLEDTVYGSSGIMNTLALVHSLDMMSTNVNATLSTIPSSGSFLPSYIAQVYGSNEKIIVAGDVYDHDEVTGSSKQSTALLAFEIMNGVGTKPHSIGTVPGTILNSYSLDVTGNTLRIATTVRNDTWITIMVDPPIIEEVDSNSTNSTNASTGSTDVVMVDTMIPVWTPPDTENYIIVLQMPGLDNATNPGVMTELGRVQLGKPKESFTAIRFFDKTAYAVTFERTDPFYVVDLSNPTNLTVSAELIISGFSSYLYPINDTLLLAVGQEADSNGTITGLQITLFDVSVPTNPLAKFRHNIEATANTWSWSDALWDFKASRYANGYFFMPVDVEDYYSVNATNAFHGTMVFQIDPSVGITEKKACRVAHTVPTYNYIYDTIGGVSVSNTKAGTDNTTMQPCNYTNGYLPRRSMVFNNDLMSTYNSEIISIDLDTCESVWKQTISIPVVGGCQVY